MITCWRCGIEFDPSKYRDGAPCLDCQETIGGEWSAGGSLRSGRISAEEKAARMKLVKDQYYLGKLDKEIADIVGMSKSTVSHYRREQGLKPHYRPEKHMWKDIDAHMAHASRMVEKRKTKSTRKKKVNDGNSNLQ